MKWIWGLLFLLTASFVEAQTTAVTALVTDADSQTWNNGTFTISFNPVPGKPGPYFYNGAPFVPQTYTGTMDASGNLAQSLPSTSFITPSGTTWKFTVCPNATAGCLTTNLAINGSSQDISSQLSSLAKGPRFPAIPGSYGYLDVEIAPVPLPGGEYFNVTSLVSRCWTGFSWTACGGGSGGTGTVVASPQFQIGYFPNAGSVATVQGGGATTDAVGNVRTLSTNGNPSAFLNQSTPTANNGLTRSLQVTGNMATADMDYPLSSFNEFQSYGNNCRAPMFWTGFPIFPVCGIADQTTAYDFRAFSRGRLDHNPNANGFGGPMDFVKLVRDNNIDGYQTFEDYVQGQQIFCCAPPSNGFGQTFMTGWEFNLQDNTNEITSVVTIQAAKPGQSDFQLLQLIQHVNGQCNTPSDECGANMRRISVVDNEPFFGSLNSTVAPGNNVFPITPDGNSVYAGEIKLMTDRTQARSPYTVTSTTGGGYPNPGTLTITQTVTPDTRCVVNSTISVNGKIHAGTTATTFAVTGCTAAIVTTSPLCIAGAQNVQSVKVTSGGTSSITANLFSGIGTGDVAYQGPNACGAVNLVANTHGAYNNILQVIGAPSAHVLEVVSMGVGNWQGGANGAFSTIHLASGVTLTRSGGTVSVPITFADTTGLFLGANFIVTSAVDSSFNGIHKVLTDDGASPISTITWADSGATATTTTTAFSYLEAASGLPANQVIYYPAVRILQAENPSTLQNDGTMVTMEHGWTGNTGDELYSGPSDQLPFTMDHSTWQNEVPTSPQLAIATYAEAQVINPCPQCSFIHVFASTNNGNSDFFGPGGGTQTPSYEFVHVGGQALYHVYNDYDFAPDNSGVVTVVRGCGLYPCTSPFSTFGVLSLPGPGGSGAFTQTWAPSIQTMQWIIGGNVIELAPTFTFFGDPVNVQAEISVNANGAGLALFSAVAATGSAPVGVYEAGAVGAHSYGFETFGTGNGAGLPGASGVQDETTHIFTWSTCSAGGIFFGTPVSGGNVCAGTGAVASISASGVIVGTSVGPSALAQWTTGAIDPTGACQTGALYSNTSGASGHVFWTCVASSWVNIK